MLPGVKLYNINKIPDARGFFSEVLRSDWKNFMEGDEVRQVNVSESKPGVVRAWHRHVRGQNDYIMALKGRLKVSIYDGDRRSATFGKLDEVILDEDEPSIVRVPGHYWHGTACASKSPSLTLYLVTRPYDYINPDEERMDANAPLNGKAYSWESQPEGRGGGRQIESTGGMKLRTSCRICNSTKIRRFLSLGPQPLANRLVKEGQAPEQFYPLDVYFCPECKLVQLANIIDLDILFGDYVYLTGASKPMDEHFKRFAADVLAKYNVKKGSLVVDLGSNDGTLLKHFASMGMEVLGVDPAENVAAMAEKNGVPTVAKPFSEELGKEIAAKHGKAAVITATNVFAHVDDIRGFAAGVRNLLADDGVFIVEAPHLLEMIRNLEFDTIYHEHMSYLSLHAMDFLFRSLGMSVVSAEKFGVHGGSIRIFVKKSGSPTNELMAMLEEEEKAGLGSFETYQKFAADVANLRSELVSTMDRLKKEGAKITAYGATAKGNTLLNYCGIGTDIIDFVSDTTPLKQGFLTPGMHIPIVPEAEFRKSRPHYALLLAWNYADAILEKEKAYLESGGKFIIPLPKPRIV